MHRSRNTVAELAEEVDLDLDEAIVTLWDAGFDELRGPSDVISAGQVRAAKRALGIATPHELTSPEYWRRLLGVEPDEFLRILEHVTIRMTPRSRRLPKGAIRKLKRVVRERLGDVEVLPPSVTKPEQVSLPPLQWELIGREQELRHLSPDQIAGIHNCLEEDFAGTDDPIQPPGVQHQHLLESAAFRQFTSLGDVTKYPTVEMAAAAITHSVVLDHAFFNGNKRTAVVAMLVFLDENGMQLTCAEDDLFRLVLLVAQHRLVPRGADDRADREVMEIARWIKKNSRRSEYGEQVLKWVRLRRILAAFRCWTEFPGGVGNRINIYREIEVARRIGRPRRRRLSTQVYYGGDGTEVERNTVGKLRKDLHLDDEHGVDSQSFYRMEVRAAEDFIVFYRKTLRRLAKL
jgi:death-on-curing family protein